MLASSSLLFKHLREHTFVAVCVYALEEEEKLIDVFGEEGKIKEKER